MKIQLPNGQNHNLDDNVDLESKLKIVDELSNEWMPIIISNWNSNSVKFFLDSLTNYLVWHKEDREEGKRGFEDKEVLSRKKVEKLSRYKKTSKVVNFTDLSTQNKEILFGERGVE